MDGQFYIYRHIRLDLNVPFYIGFGTKQVRGRERSVYARAYAGKKGRGDDWRYIVSKINYEVEILYETDDIEIAKQKEIEFISLYRETLVNVTDGGDNCSPECKKMVYQYSLDGEFIKYFQSANEASRMLWVSSSVLNRCLTGKRKSNNAFGFQWFYEFKGKQINKQRLGKISAQRSVILFNELEKFIFNSRTECGKFIKRSPSRVTDLIKIGKFNNYNIQNYAG